MFEPNKTALAHISSSTYIAVHCVISNTIRGELFTFDKGEGNVFWLCFFVGLSLCVRKNSKKVVSLILIGFSELCTGRNFQNEMGLTLDCTI